MSSTVFYKFLHQKSQSTIHFDGTGINVFDMKHEIIIQNQLGEGNDFDLKLYHLEQPDKEYDQDQDVIPRSSFVLAKRVPAASKIARFGNAARYVSGKPRINHKALNNANVSGPTDLLANQQNIDENLSEEDKIKMMFENQNTAWAQTQDELSQHRVIYNKPNAPVNPEDIPPPGYMCYRCGGRDHWIKNCPTANDPNYEGRKLRKTTGIPRSYLKTITKEAADNDTEQRFISNDEGEIIDKQGNKYMITDTGEYVIAMADSKTWQTYQEKQQNAVMKLKQEYDNKILECVEQDNKWEFINPLASTKKLLNYNESIVMLPCCRESSRLDKLKNFNYNKDELEQLLIDNDFHCPNCDTGDNFIDTFIDNSDLQQEIKKYVEEKAKELELEDPTASLNNVMKRSNDDDSTSDPKRQNTGVFPFPMVPGMPPFFMPALNTPFPMMIPPVIPPKK